MNEQQAKNLARHLIVALDVDTPQEAVSLVETLAPTVQYFKVGARMFTAAGPDILTRIGALGAKVFLDLKFHDIPSVVGDAVRIVAERHPAVFMLTVHASGGPAMVASAVEGAAHRDGLQVIAVTALTSLSPSETRLLGIDLNLDEWALKLGEMAVEAGAHGLVCSAKEVEMMREFLGPQPTIVTPGIRPDTEDRRPGDDQARITTPGQAIASGSTFLVMGRPVYEAPDPLAAVHQIGATL